MKFGFEWDQDKAAANLKKHGISSDKGRVLVVIYTERGTNIRIISCRTATPAEHRTYEEGAT